MTKKRKEKGMSKIPYFAIGNNELANKPMIGKTILHKLCGKKHIVKYGTSREYNRETKKYSPPRKSKDLGFVNCGKKTYLVSVAGKEI